MSEEKEAVSVWGYRDGENGAFEAQVFETEDGKLPKGWKDNPADCKNFKPEE